MSTPIGQQLGNYRLIRLLGRGGFADTYLGEQIYLRTPAAIKIVQAPLAQDGYESFFNEARMIAGLKHPNIVRLLDFGVESSRMPYLAMEYAPNGTLRQRHHRGEVVPVSCVVPYVKQLAAALHYAHEQRIIHRDVKPENMLVGAGNEILLADFGIAVVESTRIQTQRMIAGTMSYMAPEQIQGKPVPASDQYALAAVIYEWLCGAPPFAGSYAQVAVQHEYNLPIPLREHLATIPAAVEQVVLIALAKDPQRRFQNMPAFASAFEQASHSSSTPSLYPSADLQMVGPTEYVPPLSPLLESSAPSQSPQVSAKQTVQTGYGPQPVREQGSPSLDVLGPTSRSPYSSNPHNPHPPPPLVPESSEPRLTPQLTPQATPVTPDPQHVSVPQSEVQEASASQRSPSGQHPFQPSPVQAVLSSLQQPRHFSRWLIIANVAALLLLLGGGVLAYTTIYQPYVQSLQHQTAALQHQIAVASEDPYTHQGKLVLSDPLIDNSKGLQWAHDSINCGFIDGAYHVKAPDPNYVDDCFADASSYSDFVFEVQMRIMKGDGGAIIFRDNDTNQAYRDYIFYTYQDGSYELGMFNGPINGPTPYTTLKKGSHTAIYQGLNQVNLLAIVARGSTIVVYVNHQQIASVTNSTFSKGRIGLEADPHGSNGHPTEVIFSNVKVWALS